MALSAKWFSQCKTAKEREELEKYLKNCVNVLGLLTKIVKEDLKAATTAKRTDYDKAAWAYYQADQNGEARALRKILELIDLDKGNDKQ